MSSLVISGLRELVKTERGGCPRPSPEELAAVVNECSMVGCAVMLTLAHLERSCSDFPTDFVYGRDETRDWSFAGAGDVWRIDPLASLATRMSDRSADAEDFFERSFLPQLLMQLGMKHSRVAREAFLALPPICRPEQPGGLLSLFGRLPLHTVLSIMNHANTLAGVLGVSADGISKQVTEWYSAPIRIFPNEEISHAFEANPPANPDEAAARLDLHAKWLKSCLVAYNRRHWPRVVYDPAA
nr:hypothetical protein [Neorhizobium tomejilense]